MYTSSNNPKAFTLVELIVVIVILAILATIAFLSFSSQSASARDSTRLADMSNIAKWLSVFNATSGKVPMPDSKIDVLASGSVIWYQWYAGALVLSMLKISNWWKDPLDTSTYYTYTTNQAQSKFQILWFLEDWSNSALSYIPQLKFVTPGSIEDPDSLIAKLDSRFHGNDSPLVWVANADPSSYSWRYAYTKWDQLWILLDGNTKTPIQAAQINVDLKLDNASSSYNVIFGKESSKLNTVGTWSELLSSIINIRPDLINNKDLAFLDNNLMGYWDMETLSGWMLKDFSKNNNNWNIFWWIAVWWISWIRWKAIAFDWVDDYLSMPPAVNDMSTSTYKTLSFWAKLKSNEGSFYISFADRIQDYKDSGWFSFGNGYVKLEYYPLGATVESFYYNIPDFKTDTWYNCTYVYKSWWNTSIYLNGLKVAEWIYTVNDIQTKVFNIGRQDNKGVIFKKGSVDEVRVYNRALSDAEISVLYNSYK